ncbi:MAG: hypothetical protein R6U55_06630 [Desulfovermiculus sp.]
MQGFRHLEESITLDYEPELCIPGSAIHPLSFVISGHIPPVLSIMV